jgi:hypothetical protein
MGSKCGSRLRQLAMAGEQALIEAFDRGTGTACLCGIAFGTLPRRERDAALARLRAAAQAPGLDRMTNRRLTHAHRTCGRRLRAAFIQARLGDRQHFVGQLVRPPRCTMTPPIADGVQTAFAIELLIAEQGRAVNTQNLGQVLTLGQALRHHHGADETLGRRIVARAAHQRAGGIHEDELFGRLHDRQPRAQCGGLFGQQGKLNGAGHGDLSVSYLLIEQCRKFSTKTDSWRRNVWSSALLPRPGLTLKEESFPLTGRFLGRLHLGAPLRRHLDTRALGRKWRLNLLSPELQDTNRLLQQANERLRSLSNEISLVEEREKKRLAAQLHDSSIQKLNLAQMHSSAAVGWSPGATRHVWPHLLPTSTMQARPAYIACI